MKDLMTSDIEDTEDKRSPKEADMYCTLFWSVYKTNLDVFIFGIQSILTMRFRAGSNFCSSGFCPNRKLRNSRPS